MKTLLLMLNLLFFTLSALATEGAVYFVTPDEKIKTGSEFYVDVMVSKAPKVYGVQLELEYDTGRFTLIDGNEKKAGVQIADGDFFNTKQFFTLYNKVENKEDSKADSTADSKTGLISYTVSQVNPAKEVSGAGRLARMFFKSGEQSGSGTISIKTAEFGTRDGKTHKLTKGSPLIVDFQETYLVPKQPAQALELPSWLWGVLVLIALLLIGLLGKGKIFSWGKNKAAPVC